MNDNIKTSDDIFYEVEHSDKFADSKWVSLDWLLSDLQSISECQSYLDIRQSLLDFIDELKEG